MWWTIVAHLLRFLISGPTAASYAQGHGAASCRGIGVAHGAASRPGNPDVDLQPQGQHAHDLSVCGDTRRAVTTSTGFSLRLTAGLGHSPRRRRSSCPGTRTIRFLPVSVSSRPCDRPRAPECDCVNLYWSFALAAAGLLDGRTVTTHWASADDLERLYPQFDPPISALGGAPSVRHALINTIHQAAAGQFHQGGSHHEWWLFDPRADLSALRQPACGAHRGREFLFLLPTAVVNPSGVYTQSVHRETAHPLLSHPFTLAEQARLAIYRAAVGAGLY